MGFESEAEQTCTEEKLSFGGIHSTDFYTGMNPIVMEMGLCLKVTGEFLITMNNQKSHVNKNPRTEKKRLIEESKRNNGMGGKNKFAFRVHSEVMFIHYNNHTTICVFMCTHVNILCENNFFFSGTTYEQLTHIHIHTMC